MHWRNFGCKSEDVTRDRGILHNGGYHLYSCPNIIRVMKEGAMDSARSTQGGDEKGVRNVSVLWEWSCFVWTDGRTNGQV